MKKTFIINIGSELLYGKLNTNAQFLSGQLTRLGYFLTGALTVPDAGSLISAAVSSALGSADVVIVTGGLGPTFDDITLESISGLFKKKLAMSPEVEEKIKRYFLKKGRVPEGALRQALVIEGARVFDNPVGLCPLQILELPKEKTLVLLPGPPHELASLFKEHLFEYLKARNAGLSVTRVKLRVFGPGESAVNERIREIVETERRLSDGSVRFSVLTAGGIVDVVCFVSGPDEMENDSVAKNIKDELCGVLGDDKFGEDEETLESVTARLLMKHRRTLAVAESATGGLLSAMLVNVPGSSLYFKGGIVPYMEEVKTGLLQVPKEILSAHSDVSPETAQSMAEKAKALFRADYALSVTGYAGPSGGTAEAPVGTVFCGVAGDGGCRVFRDIFAGGRREIREKMAHFAIDRLRRQIARGE